MNPIWYVVFILRYFSVCEVLAGASYYSTHDSYVKNFLQTLAEDRP